MSLCLRRTIPVVLASVSLIAAAAPGVNACEEPRPRHCLAPSGGEDDTTLLQGALERCSGARRACTVNLCKGVFPTGILRVRDFRGTLRGAGPDKTILRALPDLPTSEVAMDFYRGDPFTEPKGPWPYLVQLVEGKARVLDLAIEIPAPSPGSKPTTGWNWFGFEFTALKGGLLLSGRDPVDFTVRHVRVEAGPYEEPLEGATAAAQLGISCEGLVFDPEVEAQYGPEAYPVFPVRGTCRIVDSVFRGRLTGTLLSETAEVTALLAGNDYRTSTAVTVADADRSHVAVLANRWRVDGRGVRVDQNLDGPPSQESAVVVSGNRGHIAPSPDYYPGAGLYFFDPPTPSNGAGTTLRVTRNRWTFGDGDLSAPEGLNVSGAGRLRILDNVLEGRVINGVALDNTTGCRVARNTFAWQEADEGRDLQLGSGTRGCLAILAPEDRYRNQGTDNRIVTTGPADVLSP
jgi:hypothetical protein